MSKIIFWLVLLGACSFFLLSCGGGSSTTATVPPGVCNFQAGGNCSLSVQGVTRTYVLHIPPNFQPNSSALVIALHGSQGSGSQFQDMSLLSNKADEVGFAVAYPDALRSSQGHTLWSVFYNDFAFTGAPPDDVGFLRQLINTLQANLHPDPKKVYVTGFSVGGYMAHRAGVQLSDLVAAIGVAEGTLSAIAPGDTRTVGATTAPVSVLILHGDQDSAIPYCGDSTATSAETSQEQTFNYWTSALANNCAAFDTTAPLCDAGGNISSVVEKDATQCKSNAEVRFYKLSGGSHNWYNSAMNVAGQVPYNPKFDVATGVDTNTILWNFFVAHPKP
jgi:polyhydroxybutyrate depolymerase